MFSYCLSSFLRTYFNSKTNQHALVRVYKYPAAAFSVDKKHEWMKDYDDADADEKNVNWRIEIKKDCSFQPTTMMVEMLVNF